MPKDLSMTLVPINLPEDVELPSVLKLGTDDDPRDVTLEEAEGMSEEERVGLWFRAQAPGEAHERTYHPFYDDAGVFACPDAKPSMTYRELRVRGFDDDRLETERTRLFGPLLEGELGLSNEMPETRETQERRREVYDAIMAQAYLPREDMEAKP